MKSNYFFKKMCLAIAAVAMGISVNAETYYVSQWGNDDNSGLSQEDAFATLQEALDMVDPGDIIAIVGTVEMKEGAYVDVAGLTFIGVCENATIDGKNRPILSVGGVLWGVGEQEYDFYFANLTFKNATRNDGSGGAIQIITDVTARFSDCKFLNNKATTASGGAISILGGEVEIYNCTFGGYNQGNQALIGGAINTGDVSRLNIENCSFLGNKTVIPTGNSVGGRGNGGALFIGGCEDLVINNCIFADNATDESEGGAGAIYLEYGSANIFNSSFYANTAKGEGGAIKVIYGNGFNIINSTLSGNTSFSGGAINFQVGEREVNIINCTVSGNVANGNTGHGGGIAVMFPKIFFNLYNSIIEGNTAKEGGDKASDIAFLYEPTIIYPVNIKNSYVGNAFTVEFWDFYNLAVIENSQYNYLDDGGFPTNSEARLSAYASTTTSGHIYYPLVEGSAGINGGDYSLLATGFGFSDDQFGIDRSSGCSVGAVQGVLCNSAYTLTVPAVDRVIEPYKDYTEEMLEFICTTGIYDVASDGAVAVAYYSVLGVKLDKEPASGVFIVKYSNGTVVKVLK